MYKYGKKLFNGGDGFLLKRGDTYYVYCTTENKLPAYTEEHPDFETCKDGKDGFEVYLSKDLVHWENGGYCLLKGENVVGERLFFAPEVYFYRNRYYMFYAAEEHIAVAVSDKPEGKFVKWTDGYLMEERAIDAHVFFDDDGVIYMYYSSLDGPNHIRVARMSDDLKRVEEYYEQTLVRAEEPWERVDAIVAEGPFVLKHKGKYYLTYSANHVRSKAYAVGYAVSDSPTGPFVKSEHNPILHSFDDIAGTGHHSFMATQQKDVYICTYHCHGGDICGFKPRKICFAEAVFLPSEDGSPDVLAIRQ